MSEKTKPTEAELMKLVALWQQESGFSQGEIIDFCDHFAAGIERLSKLLDAYEHNYDICEKQLLNLQNENMRKDRLIKDLNEELDCYRDEPEQSTD